MKTPPVVELLVTFSFYFQIILSLKIIIKIINNSMYHLSDCFFKILATRKFHLFKIKLNYELNTSI